MKRIVLIPIPAVALLLLALNLFTPEMGPDKLDFGGFFFDVFAHHLDRLSQNAKEKETSQNTGAQDETSDVRKPSVDFGKPREAHRGTGNALAGTSTPPSTPDSDAAPEFAYQVRQMYEADEHFRLYSERQISLLPSGATNLTPEAVQRAGDWKRAGDWDQGLLRMNETFNASLDPSSALAVPAFQVPAFTPAVQMPAVPTCCVAP